MKFFVNANGKYLGAWDDKSLSEPSGPPHGACEVPSSPSDARQVWQFPDWSILPPAIPLSITRRQGRLMLVQIGKLLDLEVAIDAIPDQTARLLARVEYETETWERANPSINQLGALIGLSPEDIDQLFITAAGIA